MKQETKIKNLSYWESLKVSNYYFHGHSFAIVITFIVIGLIYILSLTFK